MKKIRSLTLLLFVLLLAFGCGAKTVQPSEPAVKPAAEETKAPQKTEQPAPAGDAETSYAAGGRPEVMSQDEYMLYQNVFYADYGKELVGKTVEKYGVFVTLYDAFNARTRWYVWGYYDRTKCCDWQWEFVPKDGEMLPPDGSLVTVTGTFNADAAALDGYWITDAKVDTEKTFKGSGAALDMCAMSCTLERVQMLNILYHPEAFEGKTFSAYGRIASIGHLEDPYYNGSWNIAFSTDAEIPGIGVLVVLTGTVGTGTLTADTLALME